MGGGKDNYTQYNFQICYFLVLFHLIFSPLCLRRIFRDGGKNSPSGKYSPTVLASLYLWTFETCVNSKYREMGCQKRNTFLAKKHIAQLVSFWGLICGSIRADGSETRGLIL